MWEPALARRRTWILPLLGVLVLGTMFSLPRSVSPLAPTVAAAQDAAPPAPAEETSPKSKNLLTFYFESLGWFYTIAFLLISFCFVAVVVMCFLMLRQDQISPPALAAAFEEKLNEKKFQEAYDIAKNDPSLLGQVLAAGMGKLQTGIEPAMEAMSETAEDESMKMDHKMGYISLIAAISPMVGLLGTVDGMTQAFQKIASSGGKTPEADKLAADISTALVTTLVGLWIAIPAIAFYTFFKNRAARILLELNMTIGNLMGRFQKK